MKIVSLSTYDTNGGAAMAYYRLLKAFSKNGADISGLVQYQFSSDSAINTTVHNKWHRWLRFYRFSFERFRFLFYEKSKEYRWQFSLANTGQDLSNHPLVKSADIINLQWVNFGFQSLKTIEKLLLLNKPVVWTLHDMWSFTGGCHYTVNCTNHINQCGNCPMVRNPHGNDISHKLWMKKQALYRHKNLSFVTSSDWLRNAALESSLLKNAQVVSLPTPVDTEIFNNVADNTAIRQNLNLPVHKKLMAFGAMKVSDERKGFAYFKKAIEHLVASTSEFSATTELVIFGKVSADILEALPLKVHNMGFITSQAQIAALFNSSDLFVIPSLQDNLPNIVMESLACGVPVVAFSTGGIPQMIEHKKCGYLAEYKSATDLAHGIAYVLNNPDSVDFKQNARNKAENEFSEEVVAAKYLNYFKKLLNN